jgi:hypothetical protein
MTSIGSIDAKRLRATATTAALLAAGGVSVAGIANADPPKFDIEGYSACTATTAPAPDQDFDGVVTACCAQNAGLPTPTAYGMACVAAAQNEAADFRPTIVLPSRPQPPDDAGLLLGDMDDLSNPPLPGDPNVVGNPFDEGGPP